MSIITLDIEQREMIRQFTKGLPDFSREDCAKAIEMLITDGADARVLFPLLRLIEESGRTKATLDIREKFIKRGWLDP